MTFYDFATSIPVITLKSIMLNCYVRIHFRNNGVVVVDVGAVFGGA